jgi:hypothetical protein
MLLEMTVSDEEWNIKYGGDALRYNHPSVPTKVADLPNLGHIPERKSCR